MIIINGNLTFSFLSVSGEGHLYEKVKITTNTANITTQKI